MTDGSLDQMMSDMSTTASADPTFMANVIWRYMQAEGLTLQDLEARLAVPQRLFHRLALCKRPEKDAADFVGQVALIADFTLIDVDLLVEIIRYVDSLDSFSRSTQREAALNRTAENSAEGLLAIARDRAEDIESEDEISNEGDSAAQDR
jgi:hypothetical protein